MIYEIEPGPSVEDLSAAILHRCKDVRDGEIRFVGSGKAGIRLIFEHLRVRGVLEHKMIPVIVPPWLGTWVYAEMLPFAFPSIEATGARALLCYHQYGFPQDMDRVLEIADRRGLVVIEDCAHVCASQYKGRPLGGIGEYSLFSFSKFAFCFALGGVSSRHEDFYKFVDKACAGSSVVMRAAINGFKLIDEANLHLARPIFLTAMNGLRKMAYARYGDQILPGARAMALWQSKKAREIQARHGNYTLLRRETDRWGICDHLEADGVAPYAVPLAVNSDKAAAAVAKLQENSIAAGIRSFDFARCSFEPDYRKCVVVPIHSRMTGRGMDRLVSCLKGVL
jgi:hypothetical protein